MISNIFKKIVAYSIHVVYWILGFTTTVLFNGKYKVFGPPIWITFILIISVIYERTHMIIYNMIPKTGGLIKLNDTIYISMKLMEMLCACFCWLKYSKFRSADLIEFQNTLTEIDELLMEKQSDPIESIAIIYYVYFAINSLYNYLDYMIWKKGYVQLILMYEMMSIDMTQLQFVSQMNSCILRMRVLNKILYNTIPKECSVDFGNDIISKDSFRKSDFDFENPILVEAYEKIKKNVRSATKIFGLEVGFTNKSNNDLFL